MSHVRSIANTSIWATISASSGPLLVYILQAPCVSLQQGQVLCLFTLFAAYKLDFNSYDFLCNDNKKRVFVWKEAEKNVVFSENRHPSHRIVGYLLIIKTAALSGE